MDTLRKNSCSDSESLRKLKNGDISSLQKLYDRYVDDLYDYGMKISPNTESVKDHIHDLFLYIYDNRNKIKIEKSLKAYLFVSLRRKLIELKQKESKKVLHDTEINGDFDIQMDIENRIVESENSTELSNKLNAAINNLSKREKEIVYLKYFQSLKNNEIEDVLGLNNQTTRNLMSRSLRKLRSQIKDTNSLTIMLLG